MKKILSFLVLGFCLVMVGCSDDDNNGVSSLQVISSDVSFEANPSVGTIEVSADQQVTATTNRDWCTATVSANNRVTVEVGANADLVARTALVTIRSGNNHVEVPVYQSGMIFDVEINTVNYPTASTMEFVPVISLFDFTVTLDADAQGWITYAIVDGGVEFTAAENTTFGAKTGTATITSTMTFPGGVQQAVVNFSQEALDFTYEALLGEWAFNCVDNAGNPVSGTVTFSEADGRTTFAVQAPNQDIMYGYSFPITWPEHNKLRYYAGNTLGPFGARYGVSMVYLYVVSSGGTSLTWGATTYQDAEIVYNNGVLTARFGRTGSFGGAAYDEIGFSVGAFTSLPPSASPNYGGWVRIHRDVVMTKTL